MDSCRVCGHRTTLAFEAVVLGEHTAQFAGCNRCGFLQADRPSWLEEAYQHPINAMDTGILARNLSLAEKSAAVIWSLFDRGSKFVDYAGGYGLLVRRMRDIGFDFYWHDPHAENLIAKGFEYAGGPQKIECVTCFEAFEHFLEPMREVPKILSISKNILFSTLLLPDPLPTPETWWYYSFDHGQHISFYTEKTLQWIGREFGLVFCSNGRNLHLFTDRELSNRAFRRVLKRSSSIFRNKVSRRMESKTIADMEKARPGYAAGSCQASAHRK